MRWSVAVTVRNDRARMVELLRALERQETPPDEVVLVDAESTDGTWEAIVAFAQRAPFPVEAVQMPCSRGGGRRECVARATGDIVAFLDSDCLPPRKWLKRFQQLWKQHAEAAPGPLGALGGPYESPPSASPLSHAIDDVMGVMEAASFHGVNTGNSAYLRQAVLDAGSFDDALHTAEDPDLNARIAALGYRLVRTDNACYHERREGWSALVRQHYAYGQGGWALLERHPEYFPPIERWIGAGLAGATITGLLLGALLHPVFFPLTLLGLVAFPFVVHRRLAARYLREQGIGLAWLRRLGVLWVVTMPYHAGVLVARLARSMVGAARR